MRMTIPIEEVRREHARRAGTQAPHYKMLWVAANNAVNMAKQAYVSKSGDCYVVYMIAKDMSATYQRKIGMLYLITKTGGVVARRAEALNVTELRIFARELAQKN